MIPAMMAMLTSDMIQAESEQKKGINIKAMPPHNGSAACCFLP